jgi:zinc D-Ala-D-Ala carboxypeptidase
MFVLIQCTMAMFLLPENHLQFLASYEKVHIRRGGATLPRLFFCAVALACWRCSPGPSPTTPPAVPAALSATVTDTVGKNYLTGKFDPAGHLDFVKVTAPHTDRADMLLRRETYEAFKKMWAAAKKDGVTLKIISSTRNFDRQKAIWEGKWQRFAAETPDPEARARRIMEYSSMPGSSRHHWGTDFDLNDLNNAAFEGNGPHRRVYEWLQAHAAEYGFCQPYTPKGTARPHGYNEEKWHWTYLPLSKGLLAEYRRSITDADLTGFKGAETATSIGAVAHYVLGINTACQ